MPAAPAHPAVSYNQLDPYRRPRWRYDRVAQLVQNRRTRTATAGRDDEYITEAYQFLRSWRRLQRSSRASSHEARVAYLYPRHPLLYLAYEAFQRPLDDRSRTELEARLLAGEADAQIETKTGFPAGMVDWYEKLFFNVRDRLHQRRYIARYVIEPLVDTGLANMTFDLSAKYFAYFAGPAFLDYFLDHFVGPQFDPAADDFLKYSDKLYENTVRLRSLPAMQAFEVNGFTLEWLMQTHNQLLVEARKPKDAGLGTGSTLEDGVAAMLLAIPWSVGSERAERVAQTRLGRYANQGIELRAEEQLRLAAGEELPELEGLEQQRLPPPRQREKKPDETAQ